jgi:hypothetical protein
LHFLFESVLILYISKTNVNKKNYTLTNHYTGTKLKFIIIKK